MKMSKSKPDSAIFITDSPEEIRRKIRKAFCPEKEIVYNPVLDWVNHLVFREENSCLKIERKPKFGGDITFESYIDLETTYREGKLHPVDLKKVTADFIVDLLEPVRCQFKGKEDLLQIINQRNITR